MTTAKFGDELTCQLYARIPAGSVTADHESVKGTVTVPPSAGARGVGVGGCAAARPAPAMLNERMARSVKADRVTMRFPYRRLRVAAIPMTGHEPNMMTFLYPGSSIQEH